MIYLIHDVRCKLRPAIDIILQSLCVKNTKKRKRCVELPEKSAI
jgi:hypothetical protein